MGKEFSNRLAPGKSSKRRDLRLLCEKSPDEDTSCAFRVAFTWFVPGSWGVLWPIHRDTGQYCTRTPLCRHDRPPVSTCWLAQISNAPYADECCCPCA